MTSVYYQGPSRWQSGFYKFMNPLIRFQVLRLGLGGGGVDLLRILRVRGRKSGRVYEFPVRVAVLDNQRYIISMLGETQWVRNLRAMGTAQLIVGKTAESVHTHELQGQEKTTMLAQCCQYKQFEQRARSMLKSALKLNTKHLTPAEIDLLAHVWFVFRLEPAEGE
jgi:deazaflavin-dependent oxidoreductase (nitroreductase family)